MPAPMEAAAVVETARLYPNLEEYLETHSRADAETLFADTKKKLDHLLKGAKARAAKKALEGIAAVEGLFAHLFDVRDQLEAQATGKQKARK